MRKKQRPIGILVVDDENFFAEWLAENLRDAPQQYDAHWVNSGARALEFLDQQPVDLVISDIKMPGVSGIELLKVIRTRRPSIGVILMTGYALPELQQEAVKRGSLLYLEKPFPMDKLEAAIEQALQTLASAASPAEEDEGVSGRHGDTATRRHGDTVTDAASPRPPIAASSPHPLTSHDEPGPVEPTEPPAEVEAKWTDLSLSHAPEKPEVEVPIFSDEQRRGLRQFLAASEYLNGGALITTAGKVLDSTLPRGMLEPAVMAEAGAWSQMCHHLSEELGRGNHRQSLIQGDLGNVIVSEAGGGLFLLFVTSAKATLGLALLQARQRAQKVSEIVRGP